MATVLDLMQARGEVTPTTPDEWEAYRAKRAARRLANFNNAVTMLLVAKIKFEHMPTNDGRKLIHVDTLNGRPRIAYYPEEGKWYEYPGANAQFGIKNLIAHVKKVI